MIETQDREARQVVNIMKQAMQVDVENTFTCFESEYLYTVATSFDPRYMSKLFSSSYVNDQIKSQLPDFVKNLFRGTPSQ